jgi:hypothetical protein
VHDANESCYSVFDRRKLHSMIILQYKEKHIQKIRATTVYNMTFIICTKIATTLILLIIYIFEGITEKFMVIIICNFTGIS